MPRIRPKAVNAASPIHAARQKVPSVDMDHRGTHRFWCESRRLELAREPALTQHDQPVGELEQLLELLGHQQLRGALRSAGAQAVADCLGAAHVEAARRIEGGDETRLFAKLARHHHALNVAAGKRSQCRVQGWRPKAEPGEGRLRIRVHPRPVDAETTAIAPLAKGEVLRHAQLADARDLERILGDEGDAGLADARDRPPAPILTPQQLASPARPPASRYESAQLPLTAAGDAPHPPDLASPNRETAPLPGGGGHPPHLQRPAAPGPRT